MNKLKSATIMTILVFAAIGGCVYIACDNYDRDQRYCELMESKDEFSNEEIQLLYHWMNPDKYDDHNPSERFQKLYNEKIKPL